MANKVIPFPSDKVRTWAEIEAAIVAEIGDKSMSDYVIERLKTDFESAWFHREIDADLAINESLNSLLQNFKESISRLLVSLAAAYVEIYRVTGGER